MFAPVQTQKPEQANRELNREGRLQLETLSQNLLAMLKYTSVHGRTESAGVLALLFVTHPHETAARRTLQKGQNEVSADLWDPIDLGWLRRRQEDMEGTKHQPLGAATLQLQENQPLSCRYMETHVRLSSQGWG